LENLLIEEPLFPQKIIKPRLPNEEEPLYVQPKIFDDPIGGVLDPDRVVKTEDNDYVDLNAVLKEYGAVQGDASAAELTKEQIIADPRLMKVLRTSLAARNQTGIGRDIYRGATWLAGGKTPGGARDYSTMDAEKAFETWQEYQRSFAGGQSVTTANEVVFGLSASKDTQRKLGAGYMLFESMGNAFTGNGTLSEMADATWDYTKNAVHDPMTLGAFGIGKILSWGATKTNGLMLRNAMMAQFQNYIKSGMTATAAKKAVATTVAKAAPVTIADAAINMGVDVGYQMQLIDTGVQKEYSKAQTALAAAGAMVIPALYFGGLGVKELRKSDALKDTFIGYKEIDKVALDLGAAAATQASRARALKKQNVLIDYTDNNFGLIKGDPKQFLNWKDVKDESELGIEFRSEETSDINLVDAFYKRFWFGDIDQGKKGYYVALKDAGFVVHKSMLEENKITGVYGQAITMLPEDTVKNMVLNFEKSTGKSLGIGYTPQSVSQHFVDKTSAGGKLLWTPSEISRLDNLGLDAKELVEELAGRRVKEADKPKYQQFGLSVYKRLLTSHLATTGANIKGFVSLVTLNTYADVFTSAANFSQGAFYKYAKGDLDKAQQAYNRGYGSILGAVRRGADAVSPELSMEYAKTILEFNPKEMEKIFRDIAGDGGANDNLKLFNLDAKGRVDSQGKIINPKATLDPKGLAYKTVKTLDTTTKGAQTLTMVRLQDEITKTWAFGANVNQAIMRAYGKTPQDFFADSTEAALEMASDKFKKEVLEKATFRTLRETASVNWSTLPANNAFRAIAANIEWATNTTVAGYVVPFGSFLNTTIATMADLTGINAARFFTYKITGKQLDFATQEGAEAFGKMAAGWSAIAIGVPQAREKIAEGLAWNQDRNEDGSINDRTFEWPNSTIRVMQQIFAHGLRDSNDIRDFKYSEVPGDLLEVLADQVGGQSVRDVDGFTRTLKAWGQEIIDSQSIPEALGDFVGPPIAKVLQGATRPLDMPNQVYGLLTDSNMAPDLKQGGQTYNSALKYVNNLFDTVDGLPRKATATRGYNKPVDIGKQILAERRSPEPTPIEIILNSAGRSSWKAIPFDGPPVIRNKMNAMIEPYLNNSAVRYLRKNPTYFRMSLADKEKVISEIVGDARKQVLAVFKTGAVPKSLEMVRVLSSRDKKETQRVMDYLGVEGNIEDLLEQDDGLIILQKIKALSDNYDKIFYGDLGLD
tara:strand:+ start:965 stop:4609 length:3645 start_codon:yes stop_codon:yes gene_type:complete